MIYFQLNALMWSVRDDVLLTVECLNVECPC